MLRQDFAKELFTAVGAAPEVAAACDAYNAQLDLLRATAGAQHSAALLELDSAVGSYVIEAQMAAVAFGFKWALRQIGGWDLMTRPNE